MGLSKGDRFPASDDIVWACAVASAKQQRCHCIQRREKRALKVVCRHESSCEFHVSATFAVPYASALTTVHVISSDDDSEDSANSNSVSTSSSVEVRDDSPLPTEWKIISAALIHSCQPTATLERVKSTPFEPLMFVDECMAVVSAKFKVE